TSLWISTTGGTFANATSLSTTYIPSTTDLSNGFVNLEFRAISSGSPVNCYPSPSSSFVTITLTSIVDDGNVCTNDFCSSLGVVAHTAVPNGSSGESDGNPCTRDECMGGQTIHIPTGPAPGPAGVITGPGAVAGTPPGA